jgi:hypothetical protein
MKTGPDAHGTVKNESGSAKHENETRLLQYRRKRVQERKTVKRDLSPPVPPKTSPKPQNMKSGPDAPGIVENDYGCAKHENGIQRPRYRRK